MTPDRCLDVICVLFVLALVVAMFVDDWARRKRERRWEEDFNAKVEKLKREDRDG